MTATSSIDRIDAAVIGAGVVGLAVARALARAGREVVIVEAAESIGSGISSRNSEVIHAGLYYPAGSLKARLCVQGRQRALRVLRRTRRRAPALRQAGDRHGDSAQRRGSIAIAAAALANGVDDVQPLARAEVRALEPALRCHAALLSPSTGIVDSHALMLALLGDAEDHGAVLVLKSPLERGRVAVDGTLVLDIGGAEPTDRVRAHAGQRCRAARAAGGGVDRRAGARAGAARLALQGQLLRVERLPCTVLASDLPAA